MTRPLIISDCDEVLLHMVAPFQQWLDEDRHVLFDFSSGDFAESLRHKHDGTLVMQDQVWSLLNDFFDSEMHRQLPISDAIESMHTISEVADIAILTNLLDHRAAARAEQLARVGLHVPVHTNQGGKGRKIAEIIAERLPSVTIFIDDLATHHESAAKHTDGVWRLHLIGEPLLAEKLPPSPHAHARIDQWTDALPWIMARISDGAPAPILDAERETCPTQSTQNWPNSA